MLPPNAKKCQKMMKHSVYDISRRKKDERAEWALRLLYGTFHAYEMCKEALSPEAYNGTMLWNVIKMSLSLI